MIYSNYHTHTTYCDGENSVRELIDKAVNIGFKAIGFSAHSFTPYDTSYCVKDEKKYFDEVNLLKSEYKDRISVFCGIERDMYSNANYEYDFVIGSLHYLKLGDEYIPVDENIDITKSCINTYFNGDAMAYVKEYYSQISKMPKCDIVGHFDLITKFNKKEKLFDEESTEYKKAALDALHSVFSKNNLFEINTGGMVKGFKDVPYPAEFILKELKSIGGKIIISSDCHNKENLNAGFDNIENYLIKCGFDDRTVFTENGFKEIKL